MVGRISAGVPRTLGCTGCWQQPSWAFGLGDAVRNLIDAKMSRRTGLPLEVEGFDASLGSSADDPRDCEETKLPIRLVACRPKSVVLCQPVAAPDYRVEQERLRSSYFLRRCSHEGLPKAAVVRTHGLLSRIGARATPRRDPEWRSSQGSGRRT